jgi:glycosyltransferase involved in cell wall biosynthesis
MTVTAFQQANQLLREGKLEAAVVVYRQAIEQNPQFYGAYQNLGETLGKLGRLDQAVEMYRKAIELKPSAGWLHQELELLLEKSKILAGNEAIVRVWKPERFLNPTEFLSAKGISTTIQTSISKIVILTCVWKRPELTKVVLSYYEHLKRELAGKINLELLAVGSEGDISRNLCQELGFDYLEYPNEPLSGKWEYGLNRCSDYDPDAVIIVGSDDIISQNLIEFYAGQIQEGLVFCGLKDGYFLDMINQKLYWWVGYGDKVDYKRVGETIGMGRCLSRTLLDKLGFSIWKGLDINRSLDRAMTTRLRELGLQFSEYYNSVIAQVEGKIIRIGHCGFRMADIGACAIDIKFSDNVTPVERYFERDASVLVPQPDPWEVLQRYFPEQIIQQLKGLALVTSNIQDIAVKPTEFQKTVKQINPEQELLERKTKKLDFKIKLLEKDLANILYWRYGSTTPGIKDWEKKWDNSPGKRILYFTPIDYSGSFYKWATAVNQYSEYAVRLVTLQFHEFGYIQDLVLPISHQCEKSIRTIISEADAIHIKDELGFFPEGKKARNELPLDIFTASGKPLVYTLYGGKARRFCHDYYYRDHINSFDVAVAMTPDIAYPWIERCYFVPHSVDVDAFPYDWRDGKTISHSPSSPSRKGTELFLEAIEKLDPSLQIKLNLIQGVSHAECIARKRKSTLFFDQAGWQKSNYPGKHLTIGWYGNSALEAMVHGIPTIAHLDNAALDNAARLGVDMRKKCPVINVPMIYGNGGVEGMIENIERFFRLSKDERKELSLKTRKWVEEFHSYEVNSQQLADIYGRLLNSAPIKNTALSCSIQ